MGALTREDLQGVRRGTVVHVCLDPTKGHEQQKTRPAVVVSADRFNKTLATMTIVPLHGLGGKDARTPYINEVFIPKGEGGVREPSVAQPIQIRAIDRFERVDEIWGNLSDRTMSDLDRAIKLCLGLIQI